MPLRQSLILLVFCAAFAIDAFAHGEGERQHIFIPNKGQFHENVLFKASVDQGTVFLESNRFTYHLYDAALRDELHHNGHNMDTSNVLMNYHAFRMVFHQAGDAVVEGSDQTQHHYNFFKGNDPAKHAGKVPGFHQTHYTDLYEGIDLKLYTSHSHLKYDFIVKAGADPAAIKWYYEGIDKAKVRNKRISLNTAVGTIHEDEPYAYQIINGVETEVKCRFTETADGYITFELLEDYNSGYDLIIDPTLIFSSYSGSVESNFGYTATFDDRGYLYSGGTVFGIGYPTTMGAYSQSFAGGTGGTPINFPLDGTDIVLSKWDTSGTSLIWSTYLGGSSDEMPHSLIVNDQEELYMMGTTSSPDYPTTPGAHNTAINAIPAYAAAINLLAGLGTYYINGSDIVVTKFDSSGAALEASTYLGGTHNDGINNANILTYNYADEARGEILLDNAGDVLVVSCTRSDSIPGTTGTFQPTKPGPVATDLDGVIIKLQPDLSNVIWSTYLGGSGADAIYSVVVDDSNNLYVSGGTVSSDFPTTPGVVDPTFNNGVEAFVSYISSDGSTLLASTYRGTISYDQSYFVERDRSGDVYIFGQTEGPAGQFVFNALYNTPDAGQFITKYTPLLDSIIWSTRFGTGGRQPDISPTAFMVDLCNAVYLSGWGAPVQGSNLSTTGLDTAGGPIQGTTTGGDFYLMQLADDASSLDYATFMGGTANEHVDGGTSRFDKKGKVYQAVCGGCPLGGGQPATSDFPTFPANAHSTTNNATAGCNKAVFKVDFLLPSVVADFTMPQEGCAPFTVNFDNLSLQQGASQFLWDFGTGDTSTAAAPTYTFQNGGTYQVKLYITDSLSCNLADSIVKTIIVRTDTSFSFATVNKCMYDTAEIGFLAGNQPQGSFSWLTHPTLLDTNSPVTPVTVDYDTTFTLLIDDGICVDTAFAPVRVDTVFAQAPPDTMLCSDDLPLNLNGNSLGTGDLFTWLESGNPGDTLNSSPGDSSVILNPNAGTSIYYFNAQTNSGCTVRDTVNVSIIDLIDPLIAEFSLPDTGCAPYAVTFNNTSDSLNNTHYVWSFDTLGNSTQTNPSFTFDSSGVYEVTLIATDSGICFTQDTFSLMIPVRADSTFELNFRGCINDSISIGTPQRGGFDYSWNPKDAVADSTAAQTTTMGVRDTLLILEARGICTQTFINRIKVDSIFADSDSLRVICSDDLPVKLTGSGFGFGSEYYWASTPDFTDTLNTNFTDSTLSTSQDRGFVRYYFKVVSPEGCSDTSSTLVAVSDLLIQATPDTALCFGDTSVITAVNLLQDDNLNYSWEPVSEILSRTDSSSILVAPQTDTEYRITTVNDSGCISRDTSMVFVSNLDPASVSASASPDTIVRIESLDLFGTPDTGNYIYVWSPDENIMNPNSPATAATPVNSKTITLTVTDNRFEKCNYSDSVTITVNELICEPPVVYIPNAFSPNGDGLNDQFHVRGTHIREVDLKVYNRWGEKVFETQNPEQGWDATHNGNPVESGVYVYHVNVICLDDQRYFEKGNVTVIK